MSGNRVFLYKGISPLNENVKSKSRSCTLPMDPSMSSSCYLVLRIRYRLHSRLPPNGRAQRGKVKAAYIGCSSVVSVVDHTGEILFIPSTTTVRIIGRSLSFVLNIPSQSSFLKDYTYQYGNVIKNLGYTVSKLTTICTSTQHRIQCSTENREPLIMEPR